MHDWPNRVDIVCMNISCVERMHTDAITENRRTPHSSAREIAPKYM